MSNRLPEGIDCDECKRLRPDVHRPCQEDDKYIDDDGDACCAWGSTCENPPDNFETDNILSSIKIKDTTHE